MLEKLFVPYKESMELKELGFDEKCLGKWICEEHLPLLILNEYEYIDTRFYLAPLYSQTFKWFREKYSLEIVFRPDSFNDESKKLREYVIISYDKTWKLEEILEPSHWIRKGCFKTYEEAELECLKKLIELCKKN